jgi:hypothetical protein
MMDTLHKNVANFFQELLNDLKCQQDTKAYIISIYGKYKNANDDLSKDSVTTLFCQARDKQDFLSYQKLGDWIFFTNTVFPDSLKNASETYYNSIAQISYYNCYRMVKQWKLYQQLADEYNYLTNEIRHKIFNGKLH